MKHGVAGGMTLSRARPTRDVQTLFRDISKSSKFYTAEAPAFGIFEQFENFRIKCCILLLLHLPRSDVANRK